MSRKEWLTQRAGKQRPAEHDGVNQSQKNPLNACRFEEPVLSANSRVLHKDKIISVQKEKRTEHLGS